MSDAPREPDASLGGQAVDQGSRAAQADLTVEVIPTADEVVDDLRAQMEELDRRDKEKDAEIERANSARAAADRARQDAENRAAAADRARTQAEQVGQRSVEAAQLDSIKNALATHEGHLNSLAAQLKTASEEGDFAKVADVQKEMAKVGGRIAQLESGAADLEARVKAPPVEASPTERQPGPDDQREAFIRGQPPRVQDWLRGPNGDRYFRDPIFAEKVATAAKFAQKIKNLPIDSQAYLDYVEEQVGLRQPATDDQQQQRRDDRAPSTPGQGRTADAGQRMTTAPAGGANDGSVRRLPGGQIEVYLTREEKEQAARMGVPETEWAKNKRDLIAEGLIGPGARNR